LGSSNRWHPAFDLLSVLSGIFCPQNFMISQRTSGLNAVLALCQLLLAAVLFWVEVALVLIVPGGELPRQDKGPYLVYCAVILVGLLLETLSNRRLETHAFSRGFLDAHRLALRQTLFSGGLLLTYLVGTKDPVISRLFVATFIPSLYALLFLTHRYLPPALGRRFFGENRWEKTLLVGRVAKAEALRPWLERKADIGYRTVGMLCDDDPWEMEKSAFPRLGGTHQMVEIVRQYGVTQVIRTEMPATVDEQHFFVEACDQLGVRLLVVANLPERWGRPLTFLDDDGVRFIGLREEALENPFNQVIKRAIDLAVALPVFFFVLPFTHLLVWLCQRWQSPGPMFYRQPRAGLQNKEFNIVKYRTMNTGHNSHAKQATVGDLRIYPAGRWFRKLSVDELPQFINVLKGEMSVVGPRPHLIEHNALFARQLANYQVRTFVKPGITGLAQVRGLRGEAKTPEDISRRIAADIEYLENWRPSLEIAIILKTILHVLKPPKTAY
jgi:exopolysaccharide biosynthesis polyprenyl glycosylphosphotransferase